MALTTTDGSKTLFTYAPETTAGTSPVAVYKTLRSKTGVKFDLKRDTFASKERRADRMEGPMTYGNKSGSGSIPVEWSYGSYDDFLEAVLGGTWTSDVLKIGNTQRTFSFEETAAIGITEQKLGVQFTGLSINQKVNTIADGDFSFLFRNIHGPQTLGVNLAIDATAKTITRASAGFITVDGWEVGAAVLGLGNTDAGNNNTTPWVITSLTDTVMTFTTMVGAVTKTTTAGITLNQGSIASSVTAAATTTPFNSFTGTITEGGAVLAHVTGWDLKVDQAAQENHANGSDVAQSVSIGTIKVSGNLSVYYINQALRKKFLNGTSSVLQLVLGSVAATKAYALDMGTITYTGNSRDDGELVITESMPFSATYTAVDGTLKVTRTP